MLLLTYIKSYSIEHLNIVYIIIIILSRIRTAIQFVLFENAKVLKFFCSRTLLCTDTNGYMGTARILNFCSLFFICAFYRVRLVGYKLFLYV